MKNVIAIPIFISSGEAISFNRTNALIRTGRLLCHGEIPIAIGILAMTRYLWFESHKRQE